MFHALFILRVLRPTVLLTEERESKKRQILLGPQERKDVLKNVRAQDLFWQIVSDKWSNKIKLTKMGLFLGYLKLNCIFEFTCEAAVNLILLLKDSWIV